MAEAPKGRVGMTQVEVSFLRRLTTIRKMLAGVRESSMRMPRHF